MGQLVLQVAGAVGVVVDAAAVEHPGDRIDQVGPQAHRTQKAILHMQQGQPAALHGPQQPRPAPAPPDRHQGGRPPRSLPGKAEAQAPHRQEAAQHALLPGGEAEGLDRLRQRAAQAALQADGRDQGFWGAGQVAVGIDVERRLHQGGMHQIGQLRGPGLAPPLGGRLAIQGEAPAGVEGHAEAVHRPAPEQGLEADLGGDHIHRLSPLQQGGGMAATGLHHDPRIAELLAREMAALAARHHVRVGLHHHAAAWMGGQGGLEHGGEAGAAGRPKADGEIPGGLVDHQHKGPGGQGSLCCAVVFAHPLLPPEPLQVMAPLELSSGARAGNALLQPTGLGGVVVHPQIIEQQAQGRAVWPKAQGAHQAVLTAPEREGALGCQPFSSEGTGLAAPGQQCIEGLAPAAGVATHQGVGGQQSRQGGVLQHAHCRQAEAHGGAGWGQFGEGTAATGQINQGDGKPSAATFAPPDQGVG
jgi:hypothetical protein